MAALLVRHESYDILNGMCSGSGASGAQIGVTGCPCGDRQKLLCLVSPSLLPCDTNEQREGGSGCKHAL